MIDQTVDQNHRGLYQIAQTVPVPDFIKEASLPQPEDVQGLRSEAFADEQKRRYPLDTQENAWLSCAYFEKFASDYSKQEHARIKGRLMESAQFWGFEYPEPLAKEAAEQRQIRYRLDGVTYATTWITDENDLTKVAEALCQNPNKYPYAMRQDVARQVLSHAGELGVELQQTPQLEKTAGYAIGLTKTADHILHVRQQMLQQKEARDKIAEAREALKEADENGVLGRAMCDKVARLADAVDRLAGQHVRYGQTVTPPEQELYTLTHGDGEEFRANTVKLANGALLSLKEASSPEVQQFFKNWNGEEVSTEALPERLQKLDPNTSNLLVKALAV